VISISVLRKAGKAMTNPVEKFRVYISDSDMNSGACLHDSPADTAGKEDGTGTKLQVGGGTASLLAGIFTEDRVVDLTFRWPGSYRTPGQDTCRSGRGVELVRRPARQSAASAPANGRQLSDLIADHGSACRGTRGLPGSVCTSGGSLILPTHTSRSRDARPSEMSTALVIAARPGHRSTEPERPSIS
jgi:hypothetical protein